MSKDELVKRLSENSDAPFSKRLITTPQEELAKRLAESPQNVPVKTLTPLKSSNYIVAYLDILGATEYMKADSEKFLNNLNAIYENAFMDVHFTNLVTKKDIFIKIFSDNILIAIKTNQKDNNRIEKIEKILNIVGNIYCDALNFGYLIRGGVTEGKFFKNSSFVFGKALVEAVRLEEKNAIYPRVIIQDSLVSLISDYVLQDKDGRYFLNSFIVSGLRKHINFKTSIINQLKEFSNNEDVRQKIIWLVNYFNLFQDNRINNGIEQSKILQQDINDALNIASSFNYEVCNG